MIRILLVDDQRMIREALKISLEPEPDFKIVGIADNGISAINRVTELRPDVVLMNIEMPGLDGTKATYKITKKFPGTKVIILSSYDDDRYVTKSLAVGAKGYLLKDSAFQDIIETIRSVYKGYTQLAPGLLEKLLIQTDSGVILSKLKNPTSSVTTHNKPTREKSTPTQSTTAALTASSSITSDRSKIPIKNFSKIERDFPRIKRNIVNSSRQIQRIWIILLTSMPVVFLILLNFYNRINFLETRAIPIERVGLYGELHISGLAQRVAKAFEQDARLNNIPNLYVAQQGDTVILKGTIDNSAILKRMKNIAIDVQGVSKVDTKAIEIKDN